ALASASAAVAAVPTTNPWKRSTVATMSTMFGWSSTTRTFVRSAMSGRVADRIGGSDRVGRVVLFALLVPPVAGRGVRGDRAAAATPDPGRDDETECAGHHHDPADDIQLDKSDADVQGEREDRADDDQGKAGADTHGVPPRGRDGGSPA